MAETIQEKMTVEEFFDWQLLQDRNYELVDGVPVMTIKAVTGATDRHDRITVNAIVSLGSQLRGKPCRPKTSDTSVRTFRGTRRPDVLIECGKPGDKAMAAAEPRVVVEVLSPSTVRLDRLEKLAEYQLLAAIEVILLVYTESLSVSVWLRGEIGWMPDTISGLDAIIALPEIDASLALTDLYEGLEFDAA